MATRPTRPTPPAPTGDTPRLPPRPPHDHDDRPSEYPVQTVVVELRVVVPVPPPTK